MKCEQARRERDQVEHELFRNEEAVQVENAIRRRDENGGNGADLQDALAQVNGYASQQISAADYLHIQRLRTFLQAKVDKLFDEFDVLSTAGETFPDIPIDAPPQEDSPDETGTAIATWLQGLK